MHDRRGRLRQKPLVIPYFPVTLPVYVGFKQAKHREADAPWACAGHTMHITTRSQNVLELCTCVYVPTVGHDAPDDRA